MEDQKDVTLSTSVAASTQQQHQGGLSTILAGCSLPPPSSAQLKDKWNCAAPYFTSQLQRMSNQAAFSLATHLKVDRESVKDIVEVGSGGGGGTEILYSMKPPHARLVACDLSDAFLELAKKKMEGKEVEFMEANAENLPFEDASFDRYAANFVLHLVTDPDRMLREARRVLRPGGLAAFSVWGRAENSPQFTVLSQVAAELGIQSGDKTRSNFHLGVNLDKVKQMALQAGFSKAFTWYQPVYMDVADAESAAAKLLGAPAPRKLLEGLEPAKAEQFKQRFLERCREYYDNGQLIGLETLFLLAYV
jgi:ubiquinone/menaquinone biosynthesis C-methylase UbiE